MTKQPLAKMQRRGLIPARKTDSAVQVDVNRLYHGSEVLRLMNMAVERTEQYVRQQARTALEAGNRVQVAYGEVMDCQADLDRVITRILTKVDCLRGFELARKLNGERGEFAKAITNVFDALRLVDPDEEREARTQNAEMIDDFANSISLIVDGIDLQAERLRAIAAQMLAPDGRYIFPALDKSIHHSRLLPENEYIAEQAIRLESLGYRGEKRIKKLIDDLRANKKRDAVQDAALSTLEQYRNGDRSGDVQAFVRQVIYDLKKQR